MYQVAFSAMGRMIDDLRTADVVREPRARPVCPRRFASGTEDMSCTSAISRRIARRDGSCGCFVRGCLPWPARPVIAVSIVCSKGESGLMHGLFPRWTFAPPRLVHGRPLAGIFLDDCLPPDNVGRADKACIAEGIRERCPSSLTYALPRRSTPSAARSNACATEVLVSSTNSNIYDPYAGESREKGALATIGTRSMQGQGNSAARPASICR